MLVEDERRCVHRVGRSKTVLPQNGPLLRVESHSEAFGNIKAGSGHKECRQPTYWKTFRCDSPDLKRMSPQFGSVYALGASRVTQVAPSFFKFVELVLSDSDELHSYS